MSRVNSEDLIQVYECFCDRTRLRILNLLLASPLCVCHIEAILGGPQARISRHLGYLRRNEIVRSTRFQSWIIYSLPKKGSELLETQLRCLQDCVREIAQFRADLKQLKASRIKSLGFLIFWRRAKLQADSPRRKRHADG